MRGSEPGMCFGIRVLGGEAHLTHQDSVRHWEARIPDKEGRLGAHNFEFGVRLDF